MSDYVRMMQLQPWYHETRPRCMAPTYGGTETCTFSATYETCLSGKDIYFCKMHKQMADFPMTLIVPDKADIRELDR